MKLYIKNFSMYRSDDEPIDIKYELKNRYKLDTRRQSDFIHLAVYGAQLLKEKINIDWDDEFYMTSGIGDCDVVQRTNTYINKEKQTVKLFDFINLLGNTTSYYVAKSLGISGKNIFQISDNFTYINSLISIYASMHNSKKNAILCAIDLVSNPKEVSQRMLGIPKEIDTISSVNYQKFSLHRHEAIAEIEFDTKIYTFEELESMGLLENDMIVLSPRCTKIQKNNQLILFETMASYMLNEAMKKSNDIIYIDCFKEKYKILKLKNLR